jgi:hypothetical protein
MFIKCTFVEITYVLGVEKVRTVLVDIYSVAGKPGSCLPGWYVGVSAR